MLRIFIETILATLKSHSYIKFMDPSPQIYSKNYVFLVCNMTIMKYVNTIFNLSGTACFILMRLQCYAKK